jgi:hypothetical protein
MRTRKFTLGAFGLAALAAASLVAPVPSPALAQGDPTVGTWVLNLTKSKYDPGPAPQSLTVVRTAAGQGVKVSSTGVGADGKPTAVTYTYSFDGKDNPVTGSADYDAVAIKKTGASTMEADRKKGGKTVQTAKYSWSKDGKRLTVTATGTNAKGQKIHNVSVFDKQ